MQIDNIISKCLQNNRRAQKILYETYAPRIMAVIQRYIKDSDDAEDVLIETFIRVFGKLYQFKNEGDILFWMRRIAINEALMHLRKNKRHILSIDDSQATNAIKVNMDERLDYEKYMELLDVLPTGYRTVFNLYVIEGYKHREIAEKLKISVNTSKSQLHLAKKRLREMIDIMK